MRGRAHIAVLTACAMGALTVPATAAANHASRPHTDNMVALGHSPDRGSFLLPEGLRDANSDLAFRGTYVFHGDYDGFRIIRTSDGEAELVSRTRCNGDQGDIVVWGDFLVRAWNSPKTEPRVCDGTVVPAGFEGMHVWDISDLEDPVLVGDVELSARPEADSPGCGTHTLTLVPDRKNRRALIYNATSGGNQLLPPAERECDWLDIVEVPFDDPGAASHVRREPLEGGHAAHDNGVILGKVNLLATASGHMSNVFDIGDNDTPGGSLEDPQFLYTIEEEGVCNEGDPVLCNGNWHSAAFSWDGEVIILGWEPGGGAAPECEATDPPVKKSAFFYDADTGAKLGQWTLPRPQSAAENCTIHNYNTVPLKNGRRVLVLGNYQAGSWVVDFTDPANAQTIGWSDPPPLVPTQLGGVWSTYWYNNILYESEITRGLNLFRLSGGTLRSAIKVPHLNPQTQEFSLRAKFREGTPVGVKLVAEGLTSPVTLVPAADGSGRRFVVDQAGTIRVLTARGELLPTPFLDLRSRIVPLMSEFDERGALGLAFHPDYRNNGRFFVYYSAPLRAGAPAGYDHTARLAEFRVSDSDPDRADPASERVLLEIDKPQFNHNGGTLAFGPRDGYLYMSIGDGGGADDVGLGHVEDWYAENEGGNGQDVQSNLLGGILRIDVDGGDPYGIPADNPFAGTAGCGDGCDETWAYGLRNPYRMSFDMGGRRDLFVADAGQELWEEVSIAFNGANLGWNVKEGTHCFSTDDPDASPAECPDQVGAPHPRAGDPLIDPVIEYPNAHNPVGGLGHVVVGGHVYRGRDLRQFSGDYIFGDYSREEEEPDGSLFVSEPRPTGLWALEQLEVAQRPGGRLHHFVLGFGQDHAGEVYVLTSDASGPTGTTGRVYRLVRPRR
jgi:glucose/arabinose dehydrogenase